MLCVSHTTCNRIASAICGQNSHIEKKNDESNLCKTNFWYKIKINPKV